MTSIQTLLAEAIELHRTGRIVEASRLFESILKDEPRNLAALQHLAIIHATRGEFEFAEVLFRRAAEAAPDNPDVLSNLGRVLSERGRHEEAVACLNRALSLRPGMVEAEFNLGALHQRMGRPGRAVEYLRRVVHRQPDFTAAICLLAVGLQEDGKGEEAIAVLTDAAAARPQEAVLRHALGRLRASDGEIAEARRNFEAAIALQPSWGVPYYDLSRIHTFAAGDPKIAAMEGLVRDPAVLSLDERVGLHLALYKAWADTGQDGPAFSHLVAANTARRKAIHYDERAIGGRFQATRRVFDASLIARHANAGSPSRLPVFVIGFPRSGTTMVEQILASHPQVYGAGELIDISALAGKLSKPGRPFPESLAEDPVPDFGALGEDHARHLAELAPGAARVVDKNPGNFRRLGLIHLILPNAAIIHVRRDPMDTCFSCFENDFGDHLAFSYDMTELGRRYAAYRTMMAHWRRVLPAGRMLEIDYEALVSDLPGEARRLLAHCGLDWDERCLNFHDTRRAVFTQSQAQVRRPLYATSIGRWRRFEKQLGPLAEAMGEGTEAIGR
jgi:Flp pilus assembly protein TadD